MSTMSEYSPRDLTCESRIGPQLKVWWIPQIPMKPFEVLLNSFAEAKVILETLPYYDLFQFEQRVKPDYCNAGGLEIFDPDLEGDDGGKGDWTEWESEDGEGIDDLTLEQCIALDAKYCNKAASRQGQS